MDPNKDKTLRAIAEYLQTVVNRASQAAYGEDAIAVWEAVQPWYLGRTTFEALPKLSIYRERSGGMLGNECDIGMVLLFPHADQPQQLEGRPRFIEVAVYQALNKFSDYQDCVKVTNVTSVWNGKIPAIGFRVTIDDRHVV